MWAEEEEVRKTLYFLTAEGAGGIRNDTSPCKPVCGGPWRARHVKNLALFGC
jgi:hypothetical protein